jgi:hypothetical protein
MQNKLKPELPTRARQLGSGVKMRTPGASQIPGSAGSLPGVASGEACLSPSPVSGAVCFRPEGPKVLC